MTTLRAFSFWLRTSFANAMATRVPLGYAVLAALLTASATLNLAQLFSGGAGRYQMHGERYLQFKVDTQTGRVWRWESKGDYFVPVSGQAPKPQTWGLNDPAVGL
jgi:putative copper export protein